MAHGPFELANSCQDNVRFRLIFNVTVIHLQFSLLNVFLHNELCASLANISNIVVIEQKSIVSEARNIKIFNMIHHNGLIRRLLYITFEIPLDLSLTSDCY